MTMNTSVARRSHYQRPLDRSY